MINLEIYLSFSCFWDKIVNSVIYVSLLITFDFPKFDQWIIDLPKTFCINNTRLKSVVVWNFLNMLSTKLWSIFQKSTVAFGRDAILQYTCAHELVAVENFLMFYCQRFWYYIKLHWGTKSRIPELLNFNVLCYCVF